MKQLLALLLAFVCCSNSGGAWLSNKGTGDKPDLIEVYKSIDGKELDLHVFYRGSVKPAHPTPAIVMFHGGGFSKGDPSHFHYLCDYLASRGMVAISVRYRLNNDNIQCLRDAKSAMRHVYKHAARFGIDPEKVAAGGGSAGGCLAAALSTSKLINEPTDDLSISPEPKALVLLNPIYASKGNLGAPRQEQDDFTPMNNIHSGMAPALVLFGDEDSFVDVPTMKKFQQMMSDAGVRSELKIYPGAKHAFFTKTKEHVVNTLVEIDRFLESLGFLIGEPTAWTWADGPSKKAQR
jgi:acetyl esterase/lipase